MYTVAQNQYFFQWTWCILVEASDCSGFGGLVLIHGLRLRNLAASNAETPHTAGWNDSFISLAANKSSKT